MSAIAIKRVALSDLRGRKAMTIVRLKSRAKQVESDMAKIVVSLNNNQADFELETVVIDAGEMQAMHADLLQIIRQIGDLEKELGSGQAY